MISSKIILQLKIVARILQGSFLLLDFELKPFCVDCIKAGFNGGILGALPYRAHKHIDLPGFIRHTPTIRKRLSPTISRAHFK